jgi:DNA-binding CsgD family transcriptional regulator
VTPFDVAGEPLVVFSFEHAPAVRRALTRAENEIVLHLLDGRSNTEIARLRGRSPSTIANQVATIFKKLGVKSRLELARRW